MRQFRMMAMVVLTSFVWLAAAEAREDHITRGDAEAVLRSTGGFPIDWHAPTSAAPAGRQGVEIRPYYESGLRVCVSDWHAALLLWFDFAFKPPSTAACEDCLTANWGPVFTDKASLRASFDAIDIPLVLDGTPLDAKRTPTLPLLHEPVIEEFVEGLEQECGCDYTVTAAYYFQVGKALSPDELVVGEHTLVSGDLGTTFFVDPEGSATCQ